MRVSARDNLQIRLAIDGVFRGVSRFSNPFTQLSNIMKIAIVGAGISGLSAAYLLQNDHQVTVYEQEGYTGGHSRTLRVPLEEGEVFVDTGFIVFNRQNYPHLSQLFDRLEVPLAPSNMSFGVSIEDAWLEYSTRHFWTLWAQPGNLWRRDFWRMLYDIRRFNRDAKKFTATHPEATIQDLIEGLALGDWCCQYYLLAMAGSIWSLSREQIRDFPASTLVSFYDNHHLFTFNNEPQWYTVVGGSQEYVKRLVAGFREPVRESCAVVLVKREGDLVMVQDAQGNAEAYDQVIMACHSDQALKLLDAPTAMEQKILGNIGYQENNVVLHGDTRFMPKSRRAWASWVYLSPARDDLDKRACLSYWMNNLQPLCTSQPIMTTLNPYQEIAPEFVYNRHSFAHPVFNQAAIDHQKLVPQIQGRDGIWYCGAWQGYGFHEDGMRSAIEVVNQLGVMAPWQN